MTYMPSIISLATALLLTASCTARDTPTGRSGSPSVEFSFSLIDSKSSRLSSLDITSLVAKNLADASAVIVTIEDATGTEVYSDEELAVIQFNDDVVTRPLSLVPGEYRLTRFLVVDASGSAIYATPVVGSPGEHLVPQPLPIEFTISAEQVTALRPSVVSTADATPEDFGYTSFGLDDDAIVEVFDFLIAVFALEGTGPVLTTADLAVANELGETLFSGPLAAGTNPIRVVDGHAEYRVTVTKSGFADYSATFTGDALKAYFDSAQEGPLEVLLTPGTVIEQAQQIVTGFSHTCALSTAGRVRCWGGGGNGILGYGNTETIGDDETPASVGDIDLGGTAVQLAAGSNHTCALLDTGAVRCWGFGGNGALGYGNTENIGDDETPASAGDVDVGGVVARVAAVGDHTCAVLETGAVRCWGQASRGQLGYGNTDVIGDDETPAAAGDVNVGGVVTDIATGYLHTCALLDTGRVRCWGASFFGELGYGNTDTIGDDEVPASAGDVDIGGTVVQLSSGGFYTCAVLTTGGVRCWGLGFDGRLGHGNTENIGDDETPASAGDVNVGGRVVQVATGVELSDAPVHTCALLDTGAVRCWGENANGELGHGNTTTIGDDELPFSAGDVDVGGIVVEVDVSGHHTCALLDTGGVRCWGFGFFGQLGYGFTGRIGDDETPASVGDVPVF